MFEQSLILKDREKFIDLFLSQGVKVHSYLNPRKLKYLFEKAEDRELFVSVCLEGILGTTVVSAFFWACCIESILHESFTKQQSFRR